MNYELLLQPKVTSDSKFGYYIKRYLSQPLTPEMGEELLEYRKRILGSNSPEVERKIRALCELGYWPLEIKSVDEGTVMPVRNVLMTITNTHPDFYWTVGFVESILLKLWYSILSEIRSRVTKKY